MSFSDSEVMEIDAQDRKRKWNERFEQKKPDDIIRCLNEISDTLGQILVEIRRLHDVLDYLAPRRK